jgi:hypothetical protein
MIKKWLLLGSFGLALVVNPYLACSSSSEADFTYSESDFKDAVLGTWQGTAQIDGEAVDFSLVLEQGSLKSGAQSATTPGVAPQCGSRSFVKPAAACASMSEMPVIGTITSVNPALNGAFDGGVHAFRNLYPVHLDLRLEDGTELSGVLDKDGLNDGSLQNGSEIGKFSLTRP